MSRPRTTAHRSPAAGTRLAPWLALATFLSGVAALVYQVLWTRELGLVFGHTVAAVSTVLATFMAGLGLGSALAAGRADRLTPAGRPWVFAGLELGIAACGLAFPLVREAAPPLGLLLQRAGDDAPALLAASRLLLSAALLLIPTLLMGATLPVLAARLAPAAARTGSAAGFLYAANAAGAVAGSLAAPLLLLPRLGVRGATAAAAVLNVAAALVLVATRGLATGALSPPPAGRAKKARIQPKGEAETLGTPLVFAVVALSGMAALADEVAWTRVLVLLIGPTAYAFAFVVAAVIAGLALGSAAAAWIRARRPLAAGLAVVQFLAAFASLGVVHAVAALPLRVGELVRDNADRMDRLLGLELAGVFALLLAPCLCFGAAFPLAVGALAGRGEAPGRAVGRAYAWNTAGAIAGALLAGFVVLPRWGSRSTLLAAAAVHALAGVLALVPLRGARRWMLAVGAPVLFAFAAGRAASWDRELLAGGVYKYGAYRTGIPLEDELRSGDLTYYREGALATVSVKRLGSRLSLAVDGKIDATSAGDMLTQRLLAHVPLLLHPRPERVCVVGLGSGVTAGSALAHPVRALDAVEISPEVVEAAALFRHVNRDVLSDPRLRVRVADARNHLLAGREQYDVVISEPSNPWMAGVSSLFTRDFFRLARGRLAPGGLFCQWTHIYNMRGEELRTIVGGFVDVFPEAALFLVNEGDVLLVGGNGVRPALDQDALPRRLAHEPVRRDLDEVGLRSPYGFASLFAMETPGLAAWARDAPRHTDDRPILELQAARSLHADTARANRGAIDEAARALPPPAWVAALLSNPRARDLVERAQMLEEADSFEWAQETYRQALEQGSASREAAEGLVRTALAGGRPAAAEQDLLRAAAGSDSVAVRIGLALLYHNLGRAPEALTQLEAAARLDPRDLRVLMLGAEVQGETGNVEAMAGLADAALLLAPDDPDVQALAAEVRLRAGRPEDAARAAEQVLARNPAHERGREVAAIAAAGRGDRAAARRHFEALVSSAPDGWSYLNNFGTFELEGGDAAAAARLFERAIELNPSNLAGHRGLREAARTLGDPALVARAQRGLARMGVP